MNISIVILFDPSGTWLFLELIHWVIQWQWQWWWLWWWRSLSCFPIRSPPYTPQIFWHMAAAYEVCVLLHKLQLTWWWYTPTHTHKLPHGYPTSWNANQNRKSPPPTKSHRNEILLHLLITITVFLLEK